AEDGIRDGHVTGVQTCALPISILFMTADTDTRVDPMHAKKMAALMQAEAKNGSSRERPILLRIETKAGHGAGKPVTKLIEEGTEIGRASCREREKNSGEDERRE